MNFEDKFNRMIELIEDNVELSKEAIQNVIANDLIESGRTIAEVFNFVSGMTLKQYVMIRKCVNGLSLLHDFGFTVEESALKVGYADAPSFSKAFKGIYGTSPTLLPHKRKIEIVNTSPLYFINILNGETNKYMSANGRVTDNIFGVSVEKYNTIKRVLDLGALHGFSDEQSQLAYKLSREIHIELSDAFDFVDDFLLQCEDLSYYGQVDFIELAKVSLHNDISVFEALTVFRELRVQGIDSFSDLPEGFLEIYLNKDNRPYAFDVEFLLFVFETMKDKGIAVSEFDEILMLAGVYDTDVIEIIENYKYYEEDYNKSLFSDVGFDVSEEYYVDVDDTYTDDFLGIDTTGKYSEDFGEFSEDD